MERSILSTVSDASAGRITCGPPREGATEPCLSFIANVHQLMHHLASPIRLAAKLDETISDLIKIQELVVEMAGINQSPPEVINYSVAIKDDRKLSGDLYLTRTTDYFLTYVSGLLTLIFQKYPEALGAVPIKLNDVLHYTDRDAIVKAAIDEYVRAQSYHGLRQLQGEIKNKVGFRLFPDSKDMQFAVEIVEIRNVLVHNDGYVDSRLAKANRKYRDMEGQIITGYNAIEMVNFLTVAVQEIDIAATEKWELPPGKRTLPPPLPPTR